MTPGAFDAGAQWRLDPGVAIRPEPFGALAYHYGSRRLTFLRSPLLADLVRDLEHHDSAESALAAHVPETERPAYRRALASLAGSGFVVPAERGSTGSASPDGVGAGPDL